MKTAIFVRISKMLIMGNVERGVSSLRGMNTEPLAG
jgi:hypothetical protein